MPRYYFDTHDFDTHDSERFIRDDEGLELEGLEAASIEAAAALGEAARDALLRSPPKEVAIEVRDESSKPVLRAVLSFRVERPD